MYRPILSAIAFISLLSVTNDDLVSANRIPVAVDPFAAAATADASTALGHAEGHVDVSGTGEATYTISLHAPPGLGLTPTLALRYRSRLRNGLFGIGWVVSGLSAIKRCSRNIAPDGETGNLRVSDPTRLDRFCLNGDRLRLTSATGTYGLPGSTYQTELEGFSRVTAVDSLGSGPKSFRMDTKDGLLYEYGNSADSRVVLTGDTDAQLWALSKVSDAWGNSIRFNYRLESGSPRPATILYAGRTSVGTPANNVIEFFYEPREFGRVRVVRIEARTSGAIARQYLFTYESGTGGLNRLKSLKECAATLSQCSSPIAFDWHEGVSGFAQVSGSGSRYPQSAAFLYTVDLNADGRDDMLWYDGSRWSYALGQATGKLGTVTAGPVTARQWSQPIEWDGDGRSDLLYAASNAFRVARFNGRGFDGSLDTGVEYNASFEYWAADLDGDDRDDLVKLSTAAPMHDDHGKIWARLRRGAGFGDEGLAFSRRYAWFFGGFSTNDGYMTSHVRRPDFNADARMDLLVEGCFDFEAEVGTCTGAAGWFPFKSNVSLDASVVRPGDIYVGGDLINSAASRGLRPLLGDFNADGQTDLAYAGAEYWYLYESRGAGQTLVKCPSVAGFVLSSARVADYDGDGDSDLFAYNATNARIEVMLSNGALLEPPIPAGIAGDAMVLVGDFAGDGLADFFADLSSGYVLWNHKSGSAGSFPNFLKRATNGVGSYVELSYAPLSNYRLYRKGSAARYPIQEYQGPLYVVSNVNFNDGAGKSYELKDFSYESARVDVSGGGFLGFARRSWIDGRDGTVQRRNYRQD